MEYGKFKNRPIRQIIILFVFCLLFQMNPGIPVNAAAGMKIYNYSTGKTTVYTGKQVKYICNGIRIPLLETPGIIVDGVALGSYEDIFQNAYGMKCTLSEDQSSLTISCQGNELLLTFGSKKAVLNGKEKTMTVAPVKIKYLNSGIVKYLVPTRFVTEGMGLRYFWDSSASTVTMTRSIPLEYGGEKTIYRGLFCKASYNGMVFESYTAPNLIFANTAMVHGYQFFEKFAGVDFLYTEEDGKVYFSKGNISLEMTLGSTVVYVNGQVTDCGVAPELVLYEDSGEQAVLVPAYFVAKALGMNYEWDGESKTAIITETEKTGSLEEVILPEGSESITDSEEFLEISGDPVAGTGEIFFHWKAQDSKELSKMNQDSIIGEQENTPSYLSTIFKDTMASDIEKETYYIGFTTPVYQVESLGFDENNLLVLRFPKVLSSSRFYNLNGTLLTHIATGNSEENGQAEVKLQLSSERLGYDFHFSEDHQYLILTVYNNCLTELTAGKTEEGIHYIKFGGSFPIDAEVINLDNILMVEFPYMVNRLSETSYYYQEASELSSIVLSTPQPNYCQFVLNKSSCELVLTTETNAQDNSFTLYLSREVPGNENPVSPPLEPDSENGSEEEGGIPDEENHFTVPDNEDFGNGQRYLTIDLPDEVDAAQIRDEDHYENRQIILRIPGDYTDFYEEHPIQNTCDIVSSVYVKSGNDETVITITTDKVQAYFLEYGEGYFHLVMDVPSKFYDKIVVLDAGHGGTDPGASKNGVNEKDLNFKILNQYVREYFENSDIKIYFTRSTDILIDLYDRADYPTELDADYFVSLHMNSSTSSLSNGTGVYYSTLNSSVSENGLTSKKMAERFVNSLSAAMNTKNNGPLTANFVVIRETEVPAVLIELGFLTNTNDFKKLTSETYQKKAAKAIYQTIVGLFED